MPLSSSRSAALTLSDAPRGKVADFLESCFTSTATSWRRCLSFATGLLTDLRALLTEAWPVGTMLLISSGVK